MALGIAPAWYLATAQSQGRMANLLKLVNFVYVPVAMLAILLTGSRGALIATSVAVVYVISGFSRLKVFSRILASVFLICALFVVQILIPPETTARLLTTGDQIESRDLNGRFDLWTLGFSAFAERPVTGVGSFAFRAATERAKLAHNSALTILVESGLIGFGLFALLMIITGHQALQHKRSEAALWLAILTILAIGTFSLNWAHRKQFWLFPSLVIASASLAVWARNQARAKAERRRHTAIEEGDPAGQAPILRPGSFGRVQGLQEGG
jgi:O-antigen ligase